MKRIHLSGVCGTAMGTLAVMLKDKGHEVSGSDENVYPPMSDWLAGKGIAVAEGYSADNLKNAPDLVVVGNALSRGNPEVEYCLEARMTYRSSAETLKEEFLRGRSPVVVAGTHGKTTVTSLTAHLLEVCGKNPGFFIGGLPGNFERSGRSCEKTGGYFVVEGDEYDTAFFDKRPKFFHYLPERLLLNNIEFDHRDVFADLDAVKHSFSLMLRQMPSNGKIFVNGDDDDALDVVKTGWTPYLRVGTKADNDYRIQGIRPEGSAGTVFELWRSGRAETWRIPLIGGHNARNAAMTIAFALEEGLEKEDVQRALSSFKNVKRRQELLTENDRIPLYDDFAHHPTAVRETVSAVRERHPERRLVCLYEPCSNTASGKTHQAKLSEVFDPADCVMIAASVRMSRTPEAERLDVEAVVAALKRRSKEAFRFESAAALERFLASYLQRGDVVLAMSRGSFGNLPRRLAKRLDAIESAP